MNIGSVFVGSHDTETSTADQDRERKRRQAEQLRQRIVDKAAALERLRAERVADRAGEVPRPLLESVLHGRTFEAPAAPDPAFEAKPQPEAAAADHGVPPPMPQAQDADLGAVHEERRPSPAEHREGHASQALTRAFEELWDIEAEMHWLHAGAQALADADMGSARPAPLSGSDSARSTAEEEQPCVDPSPASQRALDRGSVQLPRAQSVATARGRLEARLAFVEGFYEGSLDDPEEMLLLRGGIAQARASLVSDVPLHERAVPDAQALEKPRPVLPPAGAVHDPLDTFTLDAPFDERDVAMLDRLATGACEALAAGSAPAALLAQLAVQLGWQPAGTGDRGGASRIGAPDGTRGVMRQVSQAGPSAVLAALHRATERMASDDERRALLTSFLGAQEQDATQQRIDSRHAGDTLPLVAVRSL